MRFKDSIPGFFLINITLIRSNSFYYDLPDVKMTRTASFGFGDKTDFTKNNKNAI